MKITQIGRGQENRPLAPQLISKLSPTVFYSIMKLLGINPYLLPMNSSKFIGLAKILNSKAITLSYNWAVKLYHKAISLGFKITLDKPHGGYSWHIHLNGAHGKLENLHIQICKQAWDYLSSLLK